LARAIRAYATLPYARGGNWVGVPHNEGCVCPFPTHCPDFEGGCPRAHAVTGLVHTTIRRALERAIRAYVARTCDYGLHGLDCTATERCVIRHCNALSGMGKGLLHPPKCAFLNAALGGRGDGAPMTSRTPKKPNGKRIQGRGSRGGHGWAWQGQVELWHALALHPPTHAPMQPHLPRYAYRVPRSLGVPKKPNGKRI
jgi:hypothetical protein